MSDYDDRELDIEPDWEWLAELDADTDRYQRERVEWEVQR